MVVSIAIFMPLQQSTQSRRKGTAFALFMEYEDQFARGPDNFGRTGKLQLKIDTAGSQPIHQQPWRFPLLRKDKIENLLKSMPDKDIIQPSKSFTIVLVKKKDGSTQFCMDYRWVNAVTRKDVYLLSQEDDTLDILSWLLGYFLLLSVHTVDYFNWRWWHLGCVMLLQRFNDWWTWFWLVYSGQVVWSI